MWARLGQLSSTARGLWLAACLVIAWVAVSPVAWLTAGFPGLAAAAGAAALCLGAAELALLVIEWVKGRQLGPFGPLVGMPIRMGLPLAAGVVVHLYMPVLAEAGWLCYLVIFYLLSLAVETILLVADTREVAIDRPLSRCR
jgi:hypothetical protein